MRLLLDTHALLWWLSDDDRLGPATRSLIAEPSNDVLVSMASLWEMVVKIRIGKLHAELGEIQAAIDRDGFRLIDVGRRHLAVLVGLPRLPDHRDPFDHLLVATAMAEEALMLSDDRNVARYPVEHARCSA